MGDTRTWAKNDGRSHGRLLGGFILSLEGLRVVAPGLDEVEHQCVRSWSVMTVFLSSSTPNIWLGVAIKVAVWCNALLARSFLMVPQSNKR